MERPRQRSYTISVEGNIGCGKSTFLNTFSAENDNIEIHKEPIEKWQNLCGHNLLDLLYDNPCRYSLPFQMYALLTMIEQHQMPNNKEVKIIERSLGRYCFVDNLHKTGKMSDVEHAVISTWFDYLAQPSSPIDISVDLVVYLRSSPEKAYERLMKRERQEEGRIPFDYICQIHELHESWLLHSKNNFDIVVIDVDEDLEQLQSIFEEKKKEILNLANSANVMQ